MLFILLPLLFCGNFKSFGRTNNFKLYQSYYFVPSYYTLPEHKNSFMRLIRSQTSFSQRRPYWKNLLCKSYKVKIQRDLDLLFKGLVPFLWYKIKATY